MVTLPTSHPPRTARERTRAWLREAELRAIRSRSQRGDIKRGLDLLEALASAQIASTHLLMEVADDLLTLRTADARIDRRD